MKETKELDEKTENLKKLTNEIGRNLSPKELRTLEVRRSVSHGDFEIFVNGRLFVGIDGNLESVMRAGVLKDRVASILEQLRGKRFHYVTNERSYSLLAVTREINYTLSSILALALTETDQNLIRKDIELRENEVFGEVTPKGKENCEVLRFVNNVLCEKLVKLTRRK
mgnify:FL=1